MEIADDVDRRRDVPARRERLWRALPAECDLLVVGDPSHLIYFAGLCAVAVRVPDGRVGRLAPARAGPSDLVADDMLGPFLDRAHSSMNWLRRSGTTANTRPRIAGASSSNRPSIAWRGCPGGESASSWRRPRGGRRGPPLGATGARDRRYRPAHPAVCGERRIPTRSRSCAARCGRRSGAGRGTEQVQPGMTELDAYLIVQKPRSSSWASR